MKKFIALGVICSVLFGVDAFSATRTPVARTSQSGGGTTAQSAAAKSAVATSGARAAVRKNAPAQVTKSNTTAQKAPVAQKQQVSARAATTQKAINTGVKIAGATANTIVDEECKTKYYGCMDSFCMLDNANGGRCLCSNRNAELDKVLEEIQKLDEQSYAMATDGVERINMGEDADAVEAMVKKVANTGQSSDAATKNKSRSLNLDAWNNITAFDDEDLFGGDVDDITTKTGDALHTAVTDVCVKQIPECAKDISMLKMMYTQQIKSDCNAYENSLKKQKNESAKKLQTAQQALREAALEQHQNQNKYDLGQCTIRFKQCMQTTAGCGEDFSKCAAVVATDNAQTKIGKKQKTKNYTINTGTTTITIAASTYDTLDSKKLMCENVTKQCVNVKDKVWPAFLREAAPELKSAELIAESNVRMNCIGNISECFQKACKDNMDPNDPEGSYDMCLSRPETMRSLCKVQIDPCEAAEPQILDYVYARLASMRVDACTNEVKSCLTDNNRCGEDYSKCIGLDFTAIREMCPLDRLVACQEKGQAATWETIDNIVQGIYLDVDNSLLNTCKNLVNAKMVEICGDEDECLAFDNDNVIGADSLTSYKANDGSFVIEGLLAFGNVKVKETKSSADNVKFGKYELDISDYSNQINNVDGTSAVKERVLSTLQSTQNKINQKIALLTSDTKISACVNGRDMSQIRGRKSKTDARYPNLLDSSIMAIINSGLEKAGKNYAKKYDELLAKAMEEQGDEKKAALCAAMAEDSSKSFAGIISTLKKNVGVSGGGYEVRHVIDGMTMNELLAQQKSGKGEFIQTDASGNMIGKIIMNAVYSAETNTCKLTTTTTLCEGIQAVYDTSSSSCGGGGIALFGSQGGCGGSGFLSIGGGGSTTSSSTYRGTICTKMAQPVIKTEDIKM